MEHLQRLLHASREHLPLRTPSSVPFVGDLHMIWLYLLRMWHASRERLPQRTVCSVPFWDLLMLQLLRPIFPYLPCLPGVLWLWHFQYSVGPHPVLSFHLNTFVVSRAFMAGAASQAGDADSSRAPGLTSGLQGSVNVHRGALLLVPHWQCISSFFFYICLFWTFHLEYPSVLSLIWDLHLCQFLSWSYWSTSEDLA